MSETRLFLETCPLAVVGVNDKGSISFWNAAAEKLFGWTSEEVLNSPLPTIPEHSPNDSAVELQMHTTSQEGAELIRMCKDGLPVHVSAWTAPLVDEAGHFEAQVTLLADVDRFRELLEAAPDAILEVDASGHIQLMNAITEKLFGYSREELLGQSVELLIPEEMRELHAAHRERYAGKPTTRPMGTGLELFGRRKDGSQFPLEISLSPMRSSKGLRVSAIIRDVSDRKRAEEKLQEVRDKFTRELEMRNREVERANRLKSEFLASMSHELRTPLHTIVGFSELLAEELDGPLTAKQKRFVDHIRHDSAHLLDLINDILDLSKIEAGRVDLHLEVFDASEAVAEVLHSITPLAIGKSIQVQNWVSGPLDIHADRLRFKQVLYNLLSNAVKFTPAEGRIAIEDSIAGAQVEFVVRDTGIGIPHEEQEAIFEKFHQVGPTTKGVREGTGLGLAITRHLVEAQGGKLWVESRMGEGSAFFFTCPCVDRPISSPEAA